MGKDKHEEEPALIHFTDGSQQQVYKLDPDVIGVDYYWDHEGKELHSFVPFAAIKRIDYLKNE